MRIAKLRIKIITLTLLPILGVLSLNTNAEVAQPQAVVETWACSYNPGKDIGDVMSARDYYVKQAEKAGITLGPAYMWSLLKGDVDFDLLWLAPHASFAAFAAAADAEAAADELLDVTARFDSAITCLPRVGNLQAMFQNESLGDGEPSASVVSSSACQLKPGIGALHMQDLGDHIAGVLGGIGSNAPNAVYAMSSMTGGPTTPEFVLFTVNESLTSYANFTGTLSGSAEGQRLGRHFNMVAECNLAMWTTQQVIEGPEA